jgi:two-component system cell cycle response regulator
MPYLQLSYAEFAGIAFPVVTIVLLAMLVRSSLLVRAARRREDGLHRANSALQQREAELAELAVTDAATGLYNRRHFFEALRSEFGRAERYRHPLSLVMVDIDNFKAVNDRLGHQAGDRVLKEVADALRANLRVSDVVCRYGGEEFAIILPETGTGQALHVCERTRHRTGSVSTGGEATVTVSQGIATYPATGIVTADDLLRRADAAMYEAKRRGRDQIAVAPVDAE